MPQQPTATHRSCPSGAIFHTERQPTNGSIILHVCHRLALLVALLLWRCAAPSHALPSSSSSSSSSHAVLHQPPAALPARVYVRAACSTLENRSATASAFTLYMSFVRAGSLFLISVGSLLAGASLAHHFWRPDTRIPPPRIPVSEPPGSEQRSSK